ncbi:MAG: glycosyltransferase [bacterium]
MSTRKLKLTVIHNLPHGGAKVLFDSNMRYLKGKFNVKVIHEPSPEKGLIKYLFHAMVYLPVFYKNILSNNKCDAYLAYHSWITKSPLFFQYANSPVIYICHEGMREYYDKQLINTFDAKDWVMNILKYPIKILDMINVKRTNIIITNSKYSKTVIDNYYLSNSRVIYPCVDIQGKKHGNSNSEDINLVSTGGIYKHKKVNFLVEVAKELQNILHKKIILNLIYSDFDHNYLKTIKKLGEKYFIKIALHNNISDEKKYDIMSKSDVYLNAAINEPFGLSVIEAYKFGMKIIARSDGGGYIEVIDREMVNLLSCLEASVWAKEIINMMNRVSVVADNEKLGTEKSMNRSLYLEIMKEITHARN